MVASFPVLAQSDPTINENLIRHLALTPEQVREIAANDGQYHERNSARQTRYFTASRRIEDVQDPLVLGARYAEIETLRREMVADLAAVRAKNRALMTPEQREKLARIENTRPFSTVVHEAVCAALIRPAADSSCFSLGPQLAVFDAVEQEVNRLRGEAYGRLQRVLLQIEIETARDPLDSARLGALHAEARRAQSEYSNVRYTFTDRLRSALTQVQEAKLRALQEAEPLRRLLPVAECEGLVPSVVSRDQIGYPTGYVAFEALYCDQREGR